MVSVTVCACFPLEYGLCKGMAVHMKLNKMK